MRKYAVLMLVALSAAALAASWSGSFRFSPNSVTLTNAQRDGRDFQLVQPVRGMSPAGLVVMSLAKPGQPLLPDWSFTLVIPQGMRVAGVDCQAGGATELGHGLAVFPGQTPVSVAQTALPPFVSPDAVVYGSDAAWPGKFAEAGPVGIKSGFRLVTITLHPLQYQPASGRLTIAGDLAVTVRFEPDPQAKLQHLTSRQFATFARDVRALVHNPADVGRNAPTVRSALFGDVDYVIITSDALSSYFQPLADWRTLEGYKTEIKPVDSIIAHYSGRDTPEKIRNFIIDYYNNKGLSYVLLGGDNAVVPCREARAICAGETGDIPCDLYYGDLQGTWDNNNNNIFGEAGVDTVDFYYEVYVGRASVDNATQAQTFVSKVLTHEQNPPTGYLKRMLMADALLWNGYDQTQSNDSIAAMLPADWYYTMIHSPGASTSVRDSINNGFQFVHLVGHGNEYGTYDGGNAYYNSDFADQQTNGSKVNFLNANSCYTGNFEYEDCVAEHAQYNPNGGSIAVVYNSRYGWGTPPYMGPSEILDVRFYDYLFNYDTMPIGVTEALSKEVYRNAAENDGCWRWCYYETNLFGDPLQLMYKDTPGQLAAAFTNPIYTGSQSFTVTVTASASPVANALVCLFKGTEVYARDYTNSSGQVAIPIDPATAGYMFVTATRANYLPADDTCQVIAGSAPGDVGVQRIVAPTDTVDTGTVITPQAWVKNYGSTAATFPVLMRIGSAYSSSKDVSNLAPGDSVPVNFDDWNAGPRGAQTVRCSTGLTGDQFPGNDTLSGSATVRVRDIGVVGINSPAGTYGPGEAVFPASTVRNYGNAPAGFEAWMLITDPKGSLCYNESTNVTDLAPGNNVVVNAFPACTLALLGDWTVKCSTAMSGDAKPANNVTTGGFRTRSEWIGMKPMPATPTSKPANDGAWLAYDAGNGLIYADKGNKTGDFYSYNPTSGLWTPLRSIPAGMEAKPPRQGACGATDGSNYIYVAKGNNTLGFWRYGIAADTWQQLPNIPSPGTHKKVKAGTGVVHVQNGDTGYIYLLKGNTSEFYRYNEVKWTWETMQPAPSGASQKWNGGSFLVSDGDHTIYAHKAKYHELWTYNTQTNSWSGTRLPGMPFVGMNARSRKSGDGGSGAWLGGDIYALKGGNTCEFWCYDPTSNSWNEFDTVPSFGSTGRIRRVYAGGSIVTAGSMLFALKGNKTYEFWRYAPGTGFDMLHSTSHIPPSPEGVMAAQTTLDNGQLEISPNPLASGFATVRYNLPQAGPATIEVYNASGRLVHSSSGIRNSSFRLDLRSMPAGVYLVRAETDGCSATQKLVVQR